jgi:hypothetical protein
LTPGEGLDESVKGVGAGPCAVFSLNKGLGSLVGELILLLFVFPPFLLLGLALGSFLLLFRLRLELLLFDAPCFF